MMVGDDMSIDRVIVGELECNCYILKNDNNVLLIDPGDEVDKIISKIGNNKLVGIIITHYHFDHIGAIDELKDRYNVSVYDINNMLEGENHIANFNFYVIYTPGHKDDSITIYFDKDKIMFTGDFLFKNTVGRCDLPGGNILDMMKSIEKIKKYKNVLVYPGHGGSTNIDDEIENNIYFKDSSILKN